MSQVVTEEFGKTQDGHRSTVNRMTLSNSKGVSVKILDLGGVISEINVPDKNGKLGDVTLGFDNILDCEKNSPYLFGAVIGRVANRIARGQFTLDGEKYNLFINNGPNAAHGGKVGFHLKMWKADVKDGKVAVTYVSKDMEENYPGELTVTVTYSLSEDNALTIDYVATTNKATILNLTNHAYFNLGEHTQGHIDDHLVTLHADAYLPVDENDLVTGEMRSVTGTIFDLRSAVRLGDRLKNVNDGSGYDNTFCLDNKGKSKLAARVEHPPSGRYMECHTTEPGLALYTAKFLTGMTGKAGATYGPFAGFCLEAQHYPDSINNPEFPTTVLRPGETYTQTTVYKFGVL